MLSTQYRLRLVGICKAIAAGQEVSLDDMIWAETVSYTHLTLPTSDLV